MQARIDRQAVRKGEIVLRIQGDVVALVRGRIPVSILGIGLLIPLLFEGDRGQRLRQEGVVDIFGAELHEVARGRHIVEVQLPAPVPDAREVVDVEIVPVLGSVVIGAPAPHPAVHPHPVAVESHGRIGEQLAGKHVVPAQGDHVVPPAEPQFGAVEPFRVRVIRFVLRVFHVHLVPAVVGGQEEAVGVGQAPGELAVQVVEEVVGVDLFALVREPLPEIPDERVEEHRVQAAGAEGIAELVLEDGPFQVELLRQDAQADAAVRFLHVAVVRADVHDGRDASAVAGRERALV